MKVLIPISAITDSKFKECLQCAKHYGRCKDEYICKYKELDTKQDAKVQKTKVAGKSRKALQRSRYLKWV